MGIIILTRQELQDLREVFGSGDTGKVKIKRFAKKAAQKNYS